MKKKWPVLFLGFAMMAVGVFFCSGKVYADVIWEPMDSFYEEHREECEYVSRRYTANGPDGEVIVYKSPENPSIVDSLENGTVFQVYYTYEDKEGVTWAIYENVETDVTGWAPFDYLTVVYDYISFEEEFNDQIEKEEGQLDASLMGKEIYFWSCPGSSEGFQVELGEEYTPEYQMTYEDENGRKWVFCNYYYGVKNRWICLDAPETDYEALYPQGSLLEKNQQEQLENDLQETLSVAEGSRIVPGGSQTPVILWLGLVIAVVVMITLLLLKKLKKEKEQPIDGGKGGQREQP